MDSKGLRLSPLPTFLNYRLNIPGKGGNSAAIGRNRHGAIGNCTEGRDKTFSHLPVRGEKRAGLTLINTPHSI
ncbi:hypothetical protein [Kamptonema formosum]|uniref:hypothetical protein n=1 Tax=Kamptonema formosum TaxID=331992 RepID=UPI00034D73E9|nr:hypothetical protein [Oscillatoria sp. PCC 10802]